MTGLLAVVLFAPAIQAAQVPAPDGSRLTPGTDTLGMYLIAEGDTVQVGVAIDELSVLGIDGVRVWHRVYRSESALLGDDLDTLIDDYASLTPLVNVRRSQGRTEVISYTGTGAQVMLFESGADTLRFEVSLVPPVYSGASFDLVLRAAPLEAGWAASVPAFMPGSRAVVALTARVAGLVRVDGEECWRVDADFAGMPVRFWISEATRRPCRYEMQVQPGVTLLFAKPRFLPQSGGQAGV